MFIKKNKYYIYIDNLSSINLNIIKINDKFNLIYRNNDKNEKISEINKFIRKCKKKHIDFFIQNDLSLALKLGASGVYLSSHNKEMPHKNRTNTKQFKIIGSAHNFSEISTKIKQGCKTIILSRLFKTDYKNKKTFYGITKFNLLTEKYNSYFVALGGIRSENLMKLKILKCHGVALLSEAKKKPAIIRRLF